MDAIEKEVLATFTDFTAWSRDGDTLVLAPDEGQMNRFREEAVDQAMLVIRRRIDKWGVAEVDVRKLGTDSIQISLPGPQNPEQAKELIGTTAQLEFRHGGRHRSHVLRGDVPADARRRPGAASPGRRRRASRS